MYVRVIAGGIAVLSVSLLATYMLFTLYGTNILQLEPALSTTALVLLYILAAVFGIYIYKEIIYEAHLRRSWLLIAIAVLISALVEVLWVVYSRFGIQPLLGLIELLSLCYYPLVLVAILTFPFTPGTRRERFIFWMDIIMATTLGMFLWVFVPRCRHL
jgi:hypothetical protein